VRRFYLPTLDIEISDIDLIGLVERVQQSQSSRKGEIIAGHNLHSIFLLHRDPDFRAFYNRPGMILADGFPIYAALKRQRNKNTKAQRLGSTDWLPEVMKSLVNKRVAVVGASREVNAEFVSKFGSASRSCTVKGWDGEEWCTSKAERIAHETLAFQPDLLVIALGMPLQEAYASRLLDAGCGGYLAVVGGACDQITGYQRNAPRWIGKFGMEWAWRLCSQPRRLSDRYLIEPWKLAWILAKRIVGLNIGH
jgi:N-acetylglucosaminyldiphosphoundecaprenol N-acetyl-beta-D-mannosaminyltransferase